MTVELPETPENRKETYLAKIAGQNVELPPEPANRVESYLAYIAENGSGGGGGGGEKDVEYVDLTLTGTSAQGITVTASKTLSEVLELADDDKKVIFRVTLPNNTGYPTQGTYELPLFNWSANPSKAIAMTVVDMNPILYSINFAYTGAGSNGIIGISVVHNYAAGDNIIIDEFNNISSIPKNISLYPFYESAMNNPEAAVDIMSVEYFNITDAVSRNCNFNFWFDDGQGGIINNDLSITGYTATYDGVNDDGTYRITDVNFTFTDLNGNGYSLVFDYNGGFPTVTYYPYI